MRLYVSLTSPYARMTRAVVIEKGLEGRVQEVVVNPFEDPAELIAANPAGLVPALAREDGGKPILDSRLICAWLDHLPSSAPPLLPAEGPARMAVRQAEALAQILTDKSVELVMEKRRPADKQMPTAIGRASAQILRVARALKTEVDAQPAPVTLGTIAIACALGHLDFRHRELIWRKDAPELAAWLDAFAQRPSLARTAPRE